MISIAIIRTRAFAAPLLFLSLSFPTTQQEQKLVRPCPSKTSPNRQVPQIVIAAVRIEAAEALSRESQNKLIRRLKERRFEFDANWIWEVENEVIGTWQDAGYFRVTAAVEPVLLQESEGRKQYALTIRVKELRQYKLAKIQIENAREGAALFFPEEKVRSLIALREGDVILAGRIRKALEAMQRLYSAVGFVDMTAEPITEIDDETATVNLRLLVDEQKQFRIGGMAIVGIDPAKQSLVDWGMKAGDIYNPYQLNAFLERNRHLFHRKVEPGDMTVSRNLKTSLVYITLDLRDCQPDPPNDHGDP